MYFFLFTGRSAFNWGAYKWGGGGLLSRGGGACNRLYAFCLPVDGPITGGEGL